MECKSILENPISQFVISFFKHFCEKYILTPTLTASHIWLLFIRCISLKIKEKPSQGHLDCEWFTDLIFFSFFFVMQSLLWWFATRCKQVLSALVMLLHLTLSKGGQSSMFGVICWYFSTVSHNSQILLAILSLLFVICLLSPTHQWQQLHQNCVHQNEGYSLPKSLWSSLLLLNLYVNHMDFFFFFCLSPCHKEVINKHLGYFTVFKAKICSSNPEKINWVTS